MIFRGKSGTGQEDGEGPRSLHNARRIPQESKDLPAARLGDRPIRTIPSWPHPWHIQGLRGGASTAWDRVSERNPRTGIYDSIGGASAVRAAVDDFYDRVLADARLAPFFTSTDLNRLKAHQRAFIAAAIGGPEVFGGRDMASAHAGLGIGEGDFDAVVGHLVGTLTGLGVPEDTIRQIGGALAPLRDDIVTTPPAELAG